MQPYFLPYIGYWQLIDNVDKFVVYDDVQYTKKGWINRNRFLMNNSDSVFTLPLRKSSDYDTIYQKSLSENIAQEKSSLLRRIENAYRRAPYFRQGYELFQHVLSNETNNLFEFIFNSIIEVRDFLDINTEIIISSKLELAGKYSSEQLVLEICKSVGASEYLNPIGGISLYNEENFKKSGIELFFQKVGNIEYVQYGGVFVSNLSIIDVIMFNSKAEIKVMLKDMSLIKKNV